MPSPSEAELEALCAPLISQFCCGNDRYGVLVYGYLFGQWRIQLTYRSQSDTGAPDGHGSIVQQLATYDPVKMITVASTIIVHAEPLMFACSHARPWNTDFPGDCIRLDNKPSDRTERIEAMKPIETPVDQLLYVTCEGDTDDDIPRTAVKRLTPDRIADYYAYFFYPIDFNSGEVGEPLINEETGESSVVKCYVVKDEHA